MSTTGRDDVCQQCKRENQPLSVMGLCPHCRISPSMPPADPERCACDESLALRAQLREAAGHLAVVLALPKMEPMLAASNRPFIYEGANAWLAAYNAKGGA